MAEDISLRIIRTTIFSIVVPHKEPCSSHKIRMEYKDMEGEEIPFADYGHRNLDEFLVAHPMLNGMKQDGKWVFTAKMSERSANIQELVRGQKSKKRKGKKGINQFARSNFSRSSYHGKPTLGQGDVRRTNGSQPFNRNTNSYRSFTTGGTSRFASTAPVHSELSQSKNNIWGSQQFGGSRPGSSLGFAGSSNAPPASRPPTQPYQPRKFIPTLPPTRPSFNSETSSSSRPDGPEEGIRRFNKILSGKCKGAATLRVFCRLYAQEFNVPFAAEELKRHFNTTNLAEVINKYGNDKILVSPTPDGSVMFTDSQVLEAHTRAARELEEMKKNSVIIEPEKKHCSIPSLKAMYDEITELLVDSFPKGIPVGEITSRYEEKAGVKVDPVAVFAHSWSELIEAKFSSRIKMSNGEAVLTPVYIKANNLQARATGERKKQELVTLPGLGIVFLEDSSQEEEDEDEEESQSETASIVSGEVKNSKGSWRAPPSGYESMCSSVSSSVQCLNVSPREAADDVISEEVDELTERMRSVKVEVDRDCPRTVTISGVATSNEQSVARRNLMNKLNEGEGTPVVAEKEKEKPAKKSFFSKLNFAFGNSSGRGNANASPSVSSASTIVKEEPKESTAHPTVTTKPMGQLKMKAGGDYKSFSISLDSKEVYVAKVTCKSAYYRILGHTSFTYPGNCAKLLQVIREAGPEGVTTVSIDFVKKAVGEKRTAVQVMEETSTPHFTIQYTFNAVSE